MITITRFTSALSASLLTLGLLASGLTATAAHADTPNHGDGAVADGATIAPNTASLKSSGMKMLSAADLPASVSLRQWSAPVADQKTTNSCVAWSLGYSMLGWYANYYGQPKNFAPMYVYSQTHLPNDGGSYVQDAYDVLGKQGIVLQSQYPQGNYNFTTPPSSDQKAAAAVNKVTAAHWLYNSDSAPGESAQVAIKTAIAAKHPVALGIVLYDPLVDLNASNSMLRGSQITPSTPSSGGHEVLVVGYDESGVTIQNQWGIDWGRNGFATLDWDFVKRYSRDASWIWGFQSMLPAQVPGSPDKVQVQSYNGSGGRSAIAYWNGTGAFDDATRNPVTGFTATLSGSDGSLRSVDVATPTGLNSASWSGLNPTVTYAVSLYAKNSVGSSAPTTISFLGSSNQIQNATAADVPSPAMPAGAAVASQPATPVTTPVTKSLSSPKYTKPSNVRYPSLVVRKSHGKVKQVSLNWMKPTKLGGSTLAGYNIKITGTKGSATKYSHTFTASKSATGKAFTFSGKYHLVRGLKYHFAIYAKNTAKLSSSGYVWKAVKL